MGAYKHEFINLSVDDAVSSALSDLSDLRDEMREWADNMDGGNLGHTEKYDAVDEVASSLENIEEDIDIPYLVEGDQIKIGQTVPRRRKYNPSRQTRHDNAVAMLVEAKERADKIRELLIRINDEDEDLDGFIDAVDDAVGYLEGLDYPGMY